jgi:MFS family permease
VFLAVQVGRFIDRGHDARAAWIGSALMALPAFGFFLWPASPVHLLLYTLFFGVGHLFLMASQQMLGVRAGGERGRDVAFGNYMVATALGSGAGPLVIGWLGGSATTPPTHLLFGVATIVALASVAISFGLRPAAAARRRQGPAPTVPIVSLLRTRGFKPILMASIVSITASDLLTIYFPLLGAERGIDVAHIGLALTVRSATSIASRLMFPSLVRIFSRPALTVYSLIVGGLAFVLLAIPMPIYGLYGATAVLGLGLGIASTLAITSIVDLVPINARGTAMTLRITGNRFGQVVVPFLGSLIAAVGGAAGVLAIIAANLIVSGLAVHLTRRQG